MSLGKARQIWHCRACDKRAYGSIGRALEIIEHMKARHAGTDHPVPRRVYPCPYNNGYHLTRQEEEVRR